MCIVLLPSRAVVFAVIAAPVEHILKTMLTSLVVRQTLHSALRSPLHEISMCRLSGHINLLQNWTEL